MKKKYIAPMSNSFSFIDALQPLCASNTKMKKDHDIQTADAFSNESNWENNMWSGMDEKE